MRGCDMKLFIGALDDSCLTPHKNSHESFWRNLVNMSLSPNPVEYYPLPNAQCSTSSSLSYKFIIYCFLGSRVTHSWHRHCTESYQHPFIFPYQQHVHFPSLLLALFSARIITTISSSYVRASLLNSRLRCFFYFYVHVSSSCI